MRTLSVLFAHATDHETSSLFLKSKTANKALDEAFSMRKQFFVPFCFE